MGEGACVLLLEELERAVARGARVYAEVLGYGTSNDAHHMAQPDPESVGVAEMMRAALTRSGVEPEQVGYINAHGTSTPQGDLAETKAIKAVFGSHAYELAVSSTKSVLGHLFGAAGAVEAMMCVRALHEGVLPPTINYRNPDPECDLDYVPNEARTCRSTSRCRTRWASAGTTRVSFSDGWRSSDDARVELPHGLQNDVREREPAHGAAKCSQGTRGRPLLHVASHLRRVGSSSIAKYTEASFNIPFARLSPAFSLPRRSRSSYSSVVSRSRPRPVSAFACRTRWRNASRWTPRSCATYAIGQPLSNTRRTARSRNSSGYPLGAAVGGASPSPTTEPGVGASKRSGVPSQS